MRLIRFADLQATPWKNGGGTTTQIAVSPAGAGFDDFDWRLSVADVSSDGPFSLFPQVDRTLTVIAGAGLNIAVDGGNPQTLTPSSNPLPFPADVAVLASLVSGPIRDFNVMTRRGRYVHRVTRHELGSSPAVLPIGQLRWLMALAAGTVEIAGGVYDMSAFDVLEIDAPASGRVGGNVGALMVHLEESAFDRA